MDELFEEMKRYVRFGDEEAEILRRFKPLAEPHLNELVEVFYARIQAHPRAHAVFSDQEQIDRLKKSLREWAERLLTGPYDGSYAALRSRIGRAHVRVGLPQHYMFTAMNVVRESLCRIADRALEGNPAERARVERALHRLLDLELSIMLESYRDDFIAKLESSERRAATMRLAAIGEVAATVAHEIRNPLAAISGTLDILRIDLPEDSPRRPVIKEAMQRIRQLDDRVRELLSYAKELRLAHSDVDVEELLRGTVALMAEEPNLHGAAIEIDVPGGIGPHNMDRARLQEVLINLLKNAGRATEGRGRVRVEARREIEGALRITVEDDGPGVPPERVEEIFRPFVTTWPEGTGLGLSICRKIAEAHGGTVTHEAPAGRGARFVVRIPRMKEPNDA